MARRNGVNLMLHVEALHIKRRVVWFMEKEGSKEMGVVMTRTRSHWIMIFVLFDQDNTCCAVHTHTLRLSHYQTMAQCHATTINQKQRSPESLDIVMIYANMLQGYYVSVIQRYNNVERRGLEMTERLIVTTSLTAPLLYFWTLWSWKISWRQPQR